MQVNTLYAAFRAIPRTVLALAGLLGIFTVLAWLFVAQANMPMAGTLDPVALLLFTVIWDIGMVAMMFPSLLPMAYTITVSTRKPEDNGPASTSIRKPGLPIRTGLFILGYVAVWTLTGVLFYLAIAGVGLVGSPLGLGSFGFWAGSILILTGLYQFTRFKQRALMKCRSPLSFILTRWRGGNLGAGVMGADYGLFCTKCCWVLMVGLLTVGAMSLALMGVFAIIIFAEKVGPFGAIVAKIVGAGFVAAGLFFLF